MTKAPQSGISRIRLLAASVALLAGVAIQPVQAQTFKVLHRLTNSQAGLVRDRAGNLYGTDAVGPGAHGSVFKLHNYSNHTKYSVLYAFGGSPDGSSPFAGLIMDAAGNLYGTTVAGGNPVCGSGCGTVFMLDTTGKETVLYRFGGSPDGANPYDAGLITDATGNLYGTTTYGGNANCVAGCGTVFKLDTTGKETVLYSFSGGTDGGQPQAGLTMDAAGNLYGTTVAGGRTPCAGDGCGTVFKLDTTGKETVLHSFSGSPDGASPYAGLLLHDGNLYGTTAWGGSGPCKYGSNSGCGTIFKVSKSGKETVLYRFAGGGADGANPYAGLIVDQGGSLYGTTKAGGAGRGCNNGGCGTIFKLDTTGKENVLFSFDQCFSTGCEPVAGLVMDHKGNLYGVSLYTAFELIP
jgi:uncharacterized repeat protein (TIGR03803 family)